MNYELRITLLRFSTLITVSDTWFVLPLNHNYPFGVRPSGDARSKGDRFANAVPYGGASAPIRREVARRVSLRANFGVSRRRQLVKQRSQTGFPSQATAEPERRRKPSGERRLTNYQLINISVILVAASPFPYSVGDSDGRTKLTIDALKVSGCTS